jgi:hypothetical protein
VAIKTTVMNRHHHHGARGGWCEVMGGQTEDSDPDP